MSTSELDTEKGLGGKLVESWCFASAAHQTFLRSARFWTIRTHDGLAHAQQSDNPVIIDTMRDILRQLYTKLVYKTSEIECATGFYLLYGTKHRVRSAIFLTVQ
jgi:hypothetical protein